MPRRPPKKFGKPIRWPGDWPMCKTSLLGQAADPAVLTLDAILSAYLKSDVKTFNLEVARYAGHLEKTSPPLWDDKKTHWETYFNHVSPFYVGIPLYVMAFLLALFGWLFRYRPLNWAAFTLIVLTFVLHTAALVLRIYISGRPPVTNLYSSAVVHRLGMRAVRLDRRADLSQRPGQHRRGGRRLCHAASSPTSWRPAATRSPCCRRCSTRSSGWRRT